MDNDRLIDLLVFQEKVEEKEAELAEAEKKLSKLESDMEEAKMTSEGFAQENAALEDKLTLAAKEAKEEVHKMEKSYSELSDKYSRWVPYFFPRCF